MAQEKDEQAQAQEIAQEDETPEKEQVNLYSAESVSTGKEMMDEKVIKEKFGLIEKELETLTRRVEKMSVLQRELDDLKFDIKP